MRSPLSAARSRTRGQRTATGPMPVMMSRSDRCPWRTSRARPSSVSLSTCPPRKPATSASTACTNSARAPLRKTSVSGSTNVPGWASLKTLVSVTAYHSFSGEVEALNTPTIRRLTPSCRHQLPRITPDGVVQAQLQILRELFDCLDADAVATYRMGLDFWSKRGTPSNATAPQSFLDFMQRFQKQVTETHEK